MTDRTDEFGPEDEARAGKTVADLVREDQLDSTTPGNFRVELEPLEEPFEDQGDGGTTL